MMSLMLFAQVPLLLLYCLRWSLLCAQHEEVAKFAAWARRQRVTSKGDVTSKHFKYRR